MSRWDRVEEEVEQGNNEPCFGGGGVFDSRLQKEEGV